MRGGERIVLPPREAGRMVLAADFCDVAVPAIFSRLDKEPPVLNSSGEVGNRFPKFFALFSRKSPRPKTCGDQRSIGPTRGNVIKAGLDFRRGSLNLFL